MLEGKTLVGLVKALAGANHPITTTACVAILLIVFTACALVPVLVMQGMGLK